MIKTKNIDAVCLNILQDSSSFGSDTNKVEFITQEKIESIPDGDKMSVAFGILEQAKGL